MIDGSSHVHSVSLRGVNGSQDILDGARRQIPRVRSSIAASALSREGHGRDMMAAIVSMAFPSRADLNVPGQFR
jgi:hypothetical protein